MFLLLAINFFLRQNMSGIHEFLMCAAQFGLDGSCLRSLTSILSVVKTGELVTCLARNPFITVRYRYWTLHSRNVASQAVRIWTDGQ